MPPKPISQSTPHRWTAPLAIIYLLLLIVLAVQSIPAQSPGMAPTANANFPGVFHIWGLDWPVMVITPTGTAGSTHYSYALTGFEPNGLTRTVYSTTLTGYATLSANNHNVITVPAWSTAFPYISPVGSCNIYRMAGGVAQGYISTLSNCAAGGTFDDIGLTATTTLTPPTDTSGLVDTAGALVARKHVAGGASVTIVSGFGSGTTLPSIVGKDAAFRITLGSTVGTSGVVQLQQTYVNTPVVICQNETTAIGVRATPTGYAGSFQVTLTQMASTWVASDNISCVTMAY